MAWTHLLGRLRRMLGVSIVGVLAAISLTLTAGTSTAAATPAPARPTSTAPAPTQKALNGTNNLNVANNWHDCHSGWVCLWGDASYTGRYVFYPQSHLSVSHIAPSMNDLTTSIWNRTSKKVCFYGDANFQKLLLCMNPGSSTPNVGSRANDSISSLQAF